MLHRLGISLNHKELEHIQALQKRFGIRSRSEFIRELVIRYENLEREFNALNQCLHGYLKQPEMVNDQDRAILKTGLQDAVSEEW